MIPFELKMDKDGLLYIEDERIITHEDLFIDKREFKNERYYSNGFFRLPYSMDYIIKYSYTIFTRKEINQIKNMLSILVSKQKEIPDIDFPIGYFKQWRKLAGLIIKYYPDGISCDNVFNHHDIEEIGKFYAHDEDNYRNLFLIFEGVLSLVQEMFENGIYYTDLNPGNIMLVDNEIKLIDFDPYYVKFTDKDKLFKSIMKTYCELIKCTLKSFYLYYEFNGELDSFEHAKTFTKKLENIVRSR